MKLIGKGSFTKAYLRDDGKVVVKSICPVKEVIAHGWCGSARFLPKIEQIDHGEYLMPLYEKPSSLKKSLKPSQYALYKNLKDMLGYRGGIQGYYNILKALKESMLSRHQKARMIEFLDGVANIGQDDVGFEISPRNVAVKNGNLVLLDVFYSISTLRTTRR